MLLDINGDGSSKPIVADDGTQSVFVSLSGCAGPGHAFRSRWLRNAPCRVELSLLQPHAGHAWSRLPDNGKTPLYDAAGFTWSNEFAGLCRGLGNRAFVDALYHNVPHRAGDAMARSFWTDA